LSIEGYEKSYHNIALIKRDTNEIFIGGKELIKEFAEGEEEMEILRADIFTKKPNGADLSDEEFMETYL